MKKLIVILFLILGLATTNAFSQELDEKMPSESSRDLKGVHSVTFLTGFQGVGPNAELTEGSGLKSTINFHGFLTYQFWPKNQYSLNFSIGILEVETGARAPRPPSKTVIPISLGYTFYPNRFEINSKARAYFGVNIGIYIEKVSDESFASGTETLTGADLHSGIDFFPSKWFRVGPQVSWHFFDSTSGPAFSINAGIFFND